MSAIFLILLEVGVPRFGNRRGLKYLISDQEKALHCTNKELMGDTNSKHVTKLFKRLVSTTGNHIKYFPKKQRDLQSTTFAALRLLLESMFSS
jgi:hypothetical protein